MIDIEEGSLCAFEKDLFSLLQSAMQIDDRVRDERPQLLSHRQKIGVHFGEGNRARAECFEDAVVLAHLGLEFFR